MGALKKPCAVCGELLRGLRTRFCSKTCADNHEQERKKKKYSLLKRHLKKRICWVCKESYEPRTSRQEVCSRRCRNILSGRKRREEKNKKITILGGGRGKFGVGKYSIYYLWFIIYYWFIICYLFICYRCGWQPI